MIFYFTGTGNSLFAAKKIHEELDHEIIDISKAMEEKQFENTLSENESIGFVIPVYYYGVPSIVEDFIKSVNVKNIQQALQEMYSLEKRPEAIIAGNDLTLIEILKYVKENSIKIPDELALIGIDDVEFASIYSPPLTTIAQPTVEMGKKAASLLIKKIKNDTDDELKLEYRFEPKLIARDSC